MKIMKTKCPHCGKLVNHDGKAFLMVPSRLAMELLGEKLTWVHAICQQKAEQEAISALWPRGCGHERHR
jgi:hypothetical protein